ATQVPPPRVHPRPPAWPGNPPRLEDALERAIAAQQVRRALGANPLGPGDTVRGVAAQRNEIRHLRGLNAVALAHLARADARHFAGADRLQDGCHCRRELKGVTVATGHEHAPATPFL